MEGVMWEIGETVMFSVTFQELKKSQRILAVACSNNLDGILNEFKARKKVFSVSSI